MAPDDSAAATREPWTLTASEAARAIAGGTLTAEALVRACLERIAAREPAVEAWAFLDADGALATAQALDRGAARGLLHGIPVGIKDNIDTHDMPTGQGSPIHEGFRPDRDAACVALTRLAGAVVLGKTVTAEFGHRHPGPTRNPHDPAYSPGGSSSGSAAAVGDRMVPVAYGTQTSGSLIRPASYCGAVGYKATYGDFNLSGMMANSPSIDTLGLIARSVEDLALFRSALLEEPLQPLAPPAPDALRVGFFRTPFWADAEAATQAALEGAATALSAAGVRVADFTAPAGFAAINEHHRVLTGFEFARTLASERVHHYDQLSPVLRDGRMADGLRETYAGYRAAEAAIVDLRAAMDAAMADVDVLLTPAAPAEAPKGLGNTGPMTFNSSWTALHMPALTLPLFTGPHGLPLGAQLIARRTQDRRLFDAAEAIRRALG
jgi:Asp-tRNA(Asn)/Glu-tRNA(Gln) amidotransferase A subunit family amidase